MQRETAPTWIRTGFKRQAGRTIKYRGEGRVNIRRPERR
jgi:hypothetical protein